jgi:hypothetical protein
VEYDQLGRGFQAVRKVRLSFIDRNFQEARSAHGAPPCYQTIVSSSSPFLLSKRTIARVSPPRFLLILFFLVASFPPLQGEEPVIGVDLLFPELAHPVEDAGRAIQGHDYRFITVNRAMTAVPGVEDHPRTVQHYGTKFMKQPLHLFVSRSRAFSYNIRVRAYATDYNKTLLEYLLQKERSKKSR